jgi:uncharacterized protein YbjQ (UPF0145 family)
MTVTTTSSVEGRKIAKYRGKVDDVYLDYGVINNMLMVSASGTAVVLD